MSFPYALSRSSRGAIADTRLLSRCGHIGKEKHTVASGDASNGNAMKHVDSSRRFIRQAQEEFAKGGRLQASEKAWGAAARAVNAVAEQRGWRHDSHARLFDVVSRIANAMDDPELCDLFHMANSVHQNFYVDWQTDDSVQRDIERVHVLVGKMERYATPP